jgi:hypothetical protein
MFYDNNIKEYGEICYNINKMYCNKFNIDIVLSNNKKYNSRHSAWERLPLILDNISNYDYVMWIDADAFFYNDSGNILDIIQEYNNFNFIFSRDINTTKDSDINTGFMIIKNSEYSINFIKRWAFDEELYKKNTRPYFWDQGVLQDMYRQNILDITKNSIVLNYGLLQHFYNYELPKLNPKPFIYHLAGRHKKTRIDETTKYYNNLIK